MHLRPPKPRPRPRFRRPGGAPTRAPSGRRGGHRRQALARSLALSPIEAGPGEPNLEAMGEAPCGDTKICSSDAASSGHSVPTVFRVILLVRKVYVWYVRKSDSSPSRL